VPPDALNDRIFDVSIFHVVKNRSGVLCSTRRSVWCIRTRRG
jgi:hypothetical protein